MSVNNVDNDISKKHILPVMLAAFFLTVNLIAFEPQNTAGDSARSREKTTQTKQKTQPSMVILPEENNDRWDSTRYPQRLRNAENILASRLGNGADGTVMPSLAANVPCWPTLQIAVFTDTLQAARDIIMKFLHNKDGMK